MSKSNSYCNYCGNNYCGGDHHSGYSNFLGICLSKKCKEAKAEKQATKNAGKDATTEYQSAIANLLNAQASSLGGGSSDTSTGPNWLLIGGITFGVIALGVTAYFVIKRKKG